MKPLTLILGLTLAGLTGSAAMDELPWLDDHDAAVRHAAEAKKPVVIFFTASWCRYCRMMKESVLVKASVQQQLRGYVRVRIDADKAPRLVAKYKAHALPAFVRLDASGRELIRVSGYQSEEAFLNWLKSEVSLPPAAVMEGPELAELRQKIVGGDRLARAAAIDEVLIRVSARESEELAELAPLLKMAATTAPGALVRALTAEQLAVRIAAVNALTEVHGDKIVFDPWAPAAARAAAAAAMRRVFAEEK